MVYQIYSELNNYQKRAFSWYLVALLIFSVGAFLASRPFPGGFDWVYTVASALASEKHNPVGSVWFSSGLALSMFMLWPFIIYIKKGLHFPYTTSVKFSLGALWLGSICGALVGLERLLIRDLSDLLYKAHEILGLCTFLGLYIGILMLLIKAMYHQKIYMVVVFLVIAPMVAIASTQLWLYINQRDLGWVDAGWREMGIPFWLSFAFWQWLAFAFLWIGLGLLTFIGIKENNT